MQFQHTICIPIYVIIVVPVVAAILTITVGLIVRKIYISQASQHPKQVRRDSTEPLMPKGMFACFFVVHYIFERIRKRIVMSYYCLHYIYVLSVLFTHYNFLNFFLSMVFPLCLFLNIIYFKFFGP